MLLYITKQMLWWGYTWKDKDFIVRCYLRQSKGTWITEKRDQIAILNRSEEKLLIKKYIEELNLDEDILNHRPRQLSGGEAQRIALLKALLLKPRLLILDEATSMLDVSTQANVISLASKAIKEINGSILLITHDKELASAISDEIYIIQGNKFRRERWKSY